MVASKATVRLARIPKPLDRYLESIVFTFREIQNWRRDAWSRDLLQTLLRTRTMVFLGYSGMDPVIHNTFRDVYEEMAQRPGNNGRSREAPAFYFGGAAKKEFHSFEILRAASAAVGDDTSELTRHANYIPFHFGGEKLPGVDDCLRWVGHRTVRQLQARAMERELAAVYRRIFHRPAPDRELEFLKQEFAARCRQEIDLARHWQNNEASRLAFEATVGRTERFHAGLMRELALGDLLYRTRQPGPSFERRRRLPWYSPIMDAPGNAAWVVVVERALDQMIAHWRGAPPEDGWPHIRYAQVPHAAILLSQGSDNPTPYCLSLYQAAFDPPHTRPAVPGVFKRHAVWRLAAATWPSQPCRRLAGAADLWFWATNGAGPRLADEDKIREIKDRVSYQLGVLDAESEAEEQSAA